MSFTIVHQTDLNCSAETLWNVLSDLEQYPQWNPFVEYCESTKKPGDPIKMKVRIFPMFAQPQTEVIKENEPLKKFSYCMKPLPLGLLSSYRYHQIDTLDDGTIHYTSSFELKGPFSHIVKALMGGLLKKGFTGMFEGATQRALNMAAK
ncbi:Uncharacterised protein [BD1-7 clade bacterium]|uniref:Polyketide cyclase n=1 Tax=BD1-7 clade bacterium TaxID=2029982 RepID=A0A5S9QX22_9GAMM|nr:Uncharacterised protein [BD1-7 clade bacterium]